MRQQAEIAELHHELADRSVLDNVARATYTHSEQEYQRSLRERGEEVASLQQEIARLRRTIIGYELQTGLEQDIEPPADYGDYPFSEN